MKNLETLAREYREIQAEIKTLKEQADAIKQQMIAKMDKLNSEVETAGEFTVRWGAYQSTRFDTKKFKEAQPELYSEYVTQTVATRFTVS